MDKMEQAQDEYADTFNGKTGEDAKDAGYGIDPGKADMDAMAKAFSEPEVEVGAPIKIEKIEAEVLPPASGESSPDPVTEAGTEKPAATEPKADATPEFKTFGQAFKYHRAQAQNGGPSTFEWNGKKFTTQLKSEVAAAKPAAKKSAAKPNAEAAKFEEEFVNRDQPKSGESPAKDGRPWYQMGPKNTFIREGDEPKNGPIYGSKPKSGESPAKDELYRGKGAYQGELS